MPETAVQPPTCGASSATKSAPVTVFISGTAAASANEGLPQEVAKAKNTHGRSVLATLVGLDHPPRQVMVTTAGVSLTMPD
jgi:hypothetical protein